MDRTVTISEERYLELIEIEKRVLMEDNDEYKLNIIIDKMDKIMNNDKYTWGDKYKRFFGPGGLCNDLKQIYPDFDWYDPDSSYEEDVCAFYNAVKERF